MLLSGWCWCPGILSKSSHPAEDSPGELQRQRAAHEAVTRNCRFRNCFSACDLQSQGAPGVPAGGGGPVPAVPEQRARQAAHGDGDSRHHHAPAQVRQQGRACGRAKAGCLGAVGRVCCRCAGLWSGVACRGWSGGMRHARTCAAAACLAWCCAWRWDSELGHAGGAWRACARHDSPLRMSGASLSSGAQLQARACKPAQHARAPATGRTLLHEPECRLCMARCGMGCRPVLCLRGWMFVYMSAAHGAQVGSRVLRAALARLATERLCSLA